jgi:hydroxyacylglutathione hydrolase
MEETIEGGKKIQDLLEGRDLSNVCGYDYVIDYGTWKAKFEERPAWIGY